MDTEELRARIASLAEAEGLSLVVLFGSGARGDAGPSGDIDIAVQGEGPIDAVHLTNQLTVALGRQDVDVTDLRRADPVLLFAAARDGIPLYEAEPTAFARFHSRAARRFYDTAKLREAERQEIHDFIEARRGAS